MPTCRARSEAWRGRLAGALLALLGVASAGSAGSAALAADPAALRERAAAQMREGGGVALRRTFEELLALERTPRALNDLGLVLSDQGEFDAAHALLGEAAATASADQRGLYQANLALNLRRQYRDGEAEALLKSALDQIERYDGPRSGWRPCNLLRSRAVASLQLSRIAERQGALAQALVHAQAAQAAAAAAIEQIPPQATPAERQWVVADLANAQRREVHVRIQAQQGAAAEQALARWRSTADAHRLGSVVRAQMHGAGAMLAMARQQFGEAARAALAADARYAEASYSPAHLARVSTLETRLAALWAARRSAEGLPLLAAFDRAAAASGGAAQLTMVRGLVYLDNGRAAEAAELFAAQQRLLAAMGAATSLAHAEALGLQGVALWSSAEAQARDGAAGERSGRGAEARELLARATEQLTTPLHASAPDGSGLRALIRRRVIEAHVASQLAGSAAPTPQLATLLDWVAEGAVQRAVTQAAARLSIADPLLRELVRREQDLRRAIDAHGRAFGGLAGGLASAADDEARALANAAAPRLDALRSEWSTLAATLREHHPDYAGLTQPLPPSLDRVTAALRQGEALLIIASREPDTLVWLLRHDGRTHSHRIALPVARVQALVSALRASLEFPERGGRLPPFDRRSAGELHRALIEPIRDALDGVSHLAVISGGPLAALPLAVLAPDDTRPLRDADWLIRRHAISQTTSLSAWLAARRIGQVADAAAVASVAGAAAVAAGAGERRLTMLGWGDPMFGAAAASTRGNARSFASLPDTRDELLAMARALGADPEHSLFLGRRATRQSILEASRSGLLAQARVVAFATHGLKAGEWPGLDQPALVMAMPESAGERPQDATDHMLRLDDTLALKLDADWVVLSACNTAAGDHEAGEALSGLVRGMFYAGARSLLATHWAVDSRSAATLVAETFKAYAGAQRPGKAQALRSAMLQLLGQPGTSHPAFWAPYGVIGDG